VPDQVQEGVEVRRKPLHALDKIAVGHIESNHGVGRGHVPIQGDCFIAAIRSKHEEVGEELLK